jgi:putative hydrolase of the HAD superfamily
MGTWSKIRPRRIRLITMDVTGTVVSFRGTLEQHYVGAAAKCGVTGVDSTKISNAFGAAYKETCEAYPCFGGDRVTAKQWWKECVVKSFRYAGVVMDEATEDQVFQRIYSTFGSNAAYEIFPDALPFLKWAQRSGLVCGVLSNADERYGDSILPMLGLTHDDLQFQCFSKDLKLEKPDARVFMSAIKAGEPFLLGNDSCDPGEVLHIGNDFRKDFEGARRVGIHSVLLDRYGEKENAAEWRRRGAVVHTDLLDVVEWLGRSGCKFG